MSAPEVWLSELHFQNWKCFRGAQSLFFDPRAYGIFARHADDARRSNWLGKSSLLEAVDFVHTGRLAKSVRGKEGWISEGERSGAVRAVWSDGTVITRDLVVGKSVRVRYAGPGEKERSGDEAKLAIAAAMGMSPRDFLETCYFQQRRMAHFITCEPSDRTKVIVGWLRLEPLQEAAAVAQVEVAAAAKARDEARRNAEAHRDSARRVLEDAGRPADAPEGWAAAAVAEAEAACKAAAERRAALEGELEDARRRDQARPLRERYDRIVADGKKLAAEAPEDGRPALEDALRAAQANAQNTRKQLVRAEDDAHAKCQLARGEFDGVCPIVSAPCPAKSVIEAQRSRNKKNAEEAAQAARELRAAHEPLDKAVDEAARAMGAWDVKRARVEQLRAEARSVKRDVEAVPAGEGRDSAAIAVDLDRAATEERVARQYGAQVAAAVKLAEESLRAAQGWERVADERGLHLTAAAEAAALLGWNGAQRRVAAAALSRVERSANALLRECSIPLSLEVSWCREGGDPADACASCGAPFPASARVKECGRCAAPRGRSVVEKTEVLVSNRSGGADDLAGGSFQLAASAWLRRRRASRWSVALIDEPFGQLDEANRTAFAGHLARMLRGEYGFRQSFVIAHHAAVLDALPGRVEISSDGKWSTARATKDSPVEANDVGGQGPLRVRGEWPGGARARGKGVR